MTHWTFQNLCKELHDQARATKSRNMYGTKCDWYGLLSVIALFIHALNVIFFPSHEKLQWGGHGTNNILLQDYLRRLGEISLYWKCVAK